jgi:hypothetical protein
MTKKRNIVRFEDVRDRIVTIRGKRVILDFAVAELYGVETKRINEAVKNNPRKFPEGWVFELDKEESADLRSIISTTNVVDNQETALLRSKSSSLELTADNINYLESLRSKYLVSEGEGGRGKYSKHNYKAFTSRRHS